MTSPTLCYQLAPFAMAPELYQYAAQPPQVVLAALREQIVLACREQGLHEGAPGETDLLIRVVLCDVDPGLFGVFTLSTRYKLCTVGVSWEIQDRNGAINWHTQTEQQAVKSIEAAPTAIAQCLRMLAVRIASSISQASRGDDVDANSLAGRYFRVAVPLALGIAALTVAVSLLVNYLRTGHFTFNSLDYLGLCGFHFGTLSLALLAGSAALAPEKALLSPRMLWLRSANGGNPSPAPANYYGWWWESF